jgi:RNA polymerase sigma factor (sigma-70 family)
MVSGAGERREFLPTRWSLLQRARSADSGEARQALEELCREYWFPLYAFVRRRGFDAHEAEDVVQSFLARLIEKDDLGSVSPQKGRFRSFLLAALQNFVANWRAREQSLKRGGGARRLEFDIHEADARLGLVARESEPPELAFERAWARELMQRCVADLEAEYRTSGRGPVFDALKTALQSSDYDSAAAVDALGLTEGAVKVAVHRLRARFRERLRARIAETVSSASEIEDELDDLFRALM